MANIARLVCFFIVIALAIIARNGESNAYSCPSVKLPSGADKEKTNALKALLPTASSFVQGLTGTVNSESPRFLPAKLRAFFSKSCDNCLITLFGVSESEISKARDVECSAELDSRNLPKLCESFVVSSKNAGTDVHVAVPASIRCQVRPLDRAQKPLRLFHARVVLQAAVKGIQRNETALFLKDATDAAFQLEFQYVDGELLYETDPADKIFSKFDESTLRDILGMIFENGKAVVAEALAQMLSKGVSLKGLSPFVKIALATII